MSQHQDAILPQDIRAAINDFVEARLKKDETIESWVEKALTVKIGRLSIGTHISKGVHSKSRGSNSDYHTCSNKSLDFAASSAHVDHLLYDVTGSAAELPAFKLLNITIKGRTLLQLIIEDHPALITSLADTAEKAQFYIKSVKESLNHWQKPRASVLNKQIYWPLSKGGGASDSADYRLLVPLHPSALCHYVFQQIQMRYSEENTQARRERFKKNSSTDAKPYFYYPDLAVIKLGGTKPQNVSHLISLQGGKNFLLPSLPPNAAQFNQFRFNKLARTIFSKMLFSLCWNDFERLFAIVKKDRNNFTVRQERTDAIYGILSQLFLSAEQIRMTQPAGWTRKLSNWDLEQQCWLDPERYEILDSTDRNDEDFKNCYEKQHWRIEISRQFSEWVINILKDKFQAKKNEFADGEHNALKKECFKMMNDIVTDDGEIDE